MNSQQMNEALDAIHEEALDMLQYTDNWPSETKERLELIISLARYKFDVRGKTS